MCWLVFQRRKQILRRLSGDFEIERVSAKVEFIRPDESASTAFNLYRDKKLWVFPRGKDSFADIIRQIHHAFDAIVVTKSEFMIRLNLD